jgi:PAS domain S-box-containing protein
MPRPGKKAKIPSMLLFETGSLSKEEIEVILTTQPIDITFVDANDTVRYYSPSPKRIFARNPAVIGKKVQQCHPPKSIDKVNAILSDFRAGRRDAAEFWINLKGRMIYIRYFALRDKKGSYLGCLEASQDITEIQKLKGEKRL